jgi:hypothetical protein
VRAIAAGARGGKSISRWSIETASLDRGLNDTHCKSATHRIGLGLFELLLAVKLIEPIDIALSHGGRRTSILARYAGAVAVAPSR